MEAPYSLGVIEPKKALTILVYSQLWPNHLIHTLSSFMLEYLLLGFGDEISRLSSLKSQVTSLLFQSVTFMISFSRETLIVVC